MGDTAVAATPEKRERTPSDMGELLNSPSAALMTLVDCDHLNDFDAVCEYLAVHAQEVVREVHGEGQPRHQGRLTIDNHRCPHDQRNWNIAQKSPILYLPRVMLNCPPAPEEGDSHGHILMKTISERSCELGISMKREFRVCDEGDNIHVREDICKGGDTMSHKEASIPKKFAASKK